MRYISGSRISMLSCAMSILARSTRCLQGRGAHAREQVKAFGGWAIAEWAIDTRLISYRIGANSLWILVIDVRQAGFDQLRAQVYICSNESGHSALRCHRVRSTKRRRR